MQRAKFNASCWSWVWLESEPERPEELELLGEPEPHAAITMPATITARAAGSPGANALLGRVVDLAADGAVANRSPKTVPNRAPGVLL